MPSDVPQATEDPTKPGAVEEVALETFKRDLCNWYPMVRSSVLFYETHEGKKATEAITEIRDALDEFWHACNAEDDTSRKVNLNNACDHLRSAAVEPLERAVEGRLAKARAKREQSETPKGRLVRRSLLLPAVAQERSSEFEELIKSDIAQGRSLKSERTTAQRAIECFTRAYSYTKDLEAVYDTEMVESRTFDVVLALVAGTVLGVVFLVLGVVLGLYFA